MRRSRLIVLSLLASGFTLGLSLVPTTAVMAATTPSTNPYITAVSVAVLGNTFTASCTHAKGVTIDYQFRVESPHGAWTTVRPYSPAATFVWSPPTHATGTYHVEAVALTAYQVVHGGRAVESPPQSLAENAYISAVTVSVSGDIVTATAIHANDVAVEYAFDVETPSGSWSVAQPFSPRNTFTWTLPADAIGTYSVQVQALTAYQVAHDDTNVALLSPTAPLSNAAIPTTDQQALSEWWPDILAASNDTGVPADLIGAEMLQESGGNPDAYNPAGPTYGLMQIEPSTAEALPSYPAYASDWETNGAENLVLGAELLQANYAATGSSNWDLAIAAYYGGMFWYTPGMTWSEAETLPSIADTNSSPTILVYVEDVNVLEAFVAANVPEGAAPPSTTTSPQ